MAEVGTKDGADLRLFSPPSTREFTMSQLEIQATEMDAIFRFRQNIKQQLDAVQKRARQRTLDFEEVANWLNRLMSAIDWCENNDVPTSAIRARIDGGAVGKAYKFRADSTSIEFSNGNLTISRGPARTANGELNYVRLISFGYNPKQLRALGCRGHAGMWDFPEGVLS